MKNPFKLALKWFSSAMPGGNVFPNVSPLNSIPVKNQDTVAAQEPFGYMTPASVKGRSSGWSVMANLSNQLDITKVQAALRAAERGDTTQLFTYYRDMFISTGMVSTELAKRKLAVLSQPHTILPFDKSNDDDVRAAQVIEDMIQNCPKWTESLIHLMNAIVFPVAVGEKLFRPVDLNEQNQFGLNYYLKEIYPVSYELINYRLPYLPQGPISAYNNNLQQQQSWFFQNNNNGFGQNKTGVRPEDSIYDVDSFEPNLRFWHVFNNGLIDYSWSNIYAPDSSRHFVYRANLLHGMARDNFGGNGRAILFWSIMAQMGREFFLRCLDRFGVPYIVATTDTSVVDNVKMLEEAFQASAKLGALVLNKESTVEIKEINMAGAGDGHEKFINLCHDQISLLINGQTLSSNAKSTGLGSGVAGLQSHVRDDIIAFDRQCLGEALRTQLFKQFLEINNVKGMAPIINWGGDAPANISDLATSIFNLAKAGIAPTPDALNLLSEKFGFALQFTGQSDDQNASSDDAEPDESEAMSPQKNELTAKEETTAESGTKDAQS